MTLLTSSHPLKNYCQVVIEIKIPGYPKHSSKYPVQGGPWTYLGCQRFLNSLLKYSYRSKYLSFDNEDSPHQSQTMGRKFE